MTFKLIIKEYKNKGGIYNESRVKVFLVSEKSIKQQQLQEILIISPTLQPLRPGALW